MCYVRLSLLATLEGHEAEARRVEEELLAFLAQQPGFVDGYLLSAPGPSPEVGRLTVWESEADADHAANLDHVLALRSRLLQITEEDRFERSFQADRRRGA